MATGIERMHFMIGEWDIQAYNIDENGTWQPSPSPTGTVIKSVFDGVFLQEDEVAMVLGGEVVRFFVMWSYDKYRQHYKMLACDEQEGLADLLIGNYAEGTDTITVTNLETGTHLLDEQGNKIYLRLVSTKTSADGFTDEVGYSDDGGITWHSTYRAEHTRRK